MWGLTFPLQKLILREEISPFLYNSLRFWIASAISVTLFGRGNWRYGSILGITLGFAYATQTWGLVFTTASKSGFITSVYVAIVPIFAYVVERERPTIPQLLGFTLTIIGLYLLAGDVGSLNFGDLLTLLCGVLFALHVVLLTRFSRKVREVDLLTPQFALVAVLNTSLALVEALRFGVQQLDLGPAAVGVASFTAVTATVLAVYIQAKYQKVVGNNISALIYVGEPLFALLLAALILGERLTFVQTLGGVLITLAMVMGGLSSNRGG